MPLIVHPHLHRRRTGVTSHVESIVPALAEARVLQSAFWGRVLKDTLPTIQWREVWRQARQSPAVWHAHRNNELLAGLILRALGAPLALVMTRHASHPPSWLTRWLLRRADAVVSLTQEIAQAVAVPSTIIAHGIDLSRFQPPSSRSAAWASLGLRGEYGVGVIGRLRPLKGQADFASAFSAVTAQFPHWQGVLVGAALKPERAWAQQLVSPSLTWVGEQKNVLPWYQGISVLVHPSYAEGLSLSFLEGMASGCCVIATRVSDFPTLIEHGRTGFLYEPGNVRELQRLLCEVLREPDKAHRVGLAAAEQARSRFGIEIEAQKLRELYHSLVGK